MGPEGSGPTGEGEGSAVVDGFAEAFSEGLEVSFGYDVDCEESSGRHATTPKVVRIDTTARATTRFALIVGSERISRLSH